MGSFWQHFLASASKRYACDICGLRGPWRFWSFTAMLDGYAHEVEAHRGVSRG